MRYRRRSRVREGALGFLSWGQAMPCAGGLHQRVQCLAAASHRRACGSGFGFQAAHYSDSHAIAWDLLGATRIHAELVFDGTQVGRKRVVQFLREMGMMGVSRRKGVRTTRQTRHECAAADLVNRKYTVAAPDQLWVADISYVST